MSANELTDDPFKAALGDSRGAGQGNWDEELPEVNVQDRDRFDLANESIDSGSFVVIYPDGSFLAYSETTGGVWAVDIFANATIFPYEKMAMKWMRVHKLQGGKVRKIEALLLEPLGS